jgi:hypothetical protein
LKIIEVYDKQGNLIYLTEERWYHIVEVHPEIERYKEELIETLKKGKRKQDPFDQTKYKYYRYFNNLEKGYNHIIAVVKFKNIGEEKQNNFVLTAYQVFIYGVQQ